MIVPFGRSELELGPLLDALGRLECRGGDELIVADNRRVRRAPPALARSSMRIVPARGVRSPGFARNIGARIATGDWLLFLDADTEPDPHLIEAYFDPPPGERTAVLAGCIIDVESRPTGAARHSVARGQMSQRATLERDGTPYAQTANCAVRRSAFVAVGGFADEIRAGEDADLCFRLARAGWALEERPRARVTHRSRSTLPALLAQVARHGSGAAWLNRHYPGEFDPPRPRELAARVARGAAGLGAALVRGEREGAAFAALDVLTQTAFDLGRLLPNRARRG